MLSLPSRYNFCHLSHQTHNHIFLTISGDVTDNDDGEEDQEYGDTVPPPDEKGLNDLPKTGGASAPTAPPHGWPCTYKNCKTISNTKRGRESHISEKHVKPKTDCNVCGLARVSVQGVKSLGGHFACLCRGFEFYEVKKIFFCYYFSKRKWKYFYTFYHFHSEKSSKRAK